MASIKFKTSIKTYDINGDKDRTVSINTADLGIFERAKKSMEMFADMQNEYKNIDGADAWDMMSEYDKKIRKQINYIFGTDVCTPAFGNTNCFSFVDGVPMFVGFLNALLEEVKKDMQKSKSQMEKNISKYTSQVKK